VGYSRIGKSEEDYTWQGQAIWGHIGAFGLLAFLLFRYLRSIGLSNHWRILLGVGLTITAMGRLAYTIHKCCRALACSFARNKYLLPQGTLSLPQAAFTLSGVRKHGYALHRKHSL